MSKSAMDQINDLQADLRDSEAEEAAIRSKFGNQPVKHNVSKYVEDAPPVTKPAKAPRKRIGGTPPPETFAPADNFKYMTNIRNKETGHIEEVEREISLVNFPRYIAILSCCAENRLATLAHLVEYMFPVQDGKLRTEEETFKLQDSVRTTNVVKLLKGGYLRKQTVQGKTAYFPTDKGTHHLEYVVAAYDAATSPDTPFEIANQATLAIALGVPNNKGLLDMKEQGTMVPGFPVLTRQRLLTSAPAKFASQRQAENEQIKQMAAFLESGALPTVAPNWDRNTMSTTEALTILRALQTPVQIPIETPLGKANAYINPASLFQTFDPSGSPENFIHMVVGMPNIAKWDYETSKQVTINGCIAIRNELSEQTTEFYRYMLLQVFRLFTVRSTDPNEPVHLSHAGFRRFLIKSPNMLIRAAIHNEWLDMILTGKIPRQYANWLGIEGYKPINASDIQPDPFSLNKGRVELQNWAVG